MFTCYSDNIQKGHYIVKNGLTNEQFRTLEESLTYIKKVSCDMDYWCLIDQNINRMKEAINNFHFGKPENLVEINGALSNLLSAYYLWKCYNRDKSDNTFKFIQEEYRSKHVECYLISELRNYVAHNGFAISVASFDVLNEVLKLNVRPKDIIDSMAKAKKKPNAAFKQYLSDLISSSKDIDIIPLIDQFRMIYTEIQKQLWQQQEANVRTALKEVFTIVPKESPDLYNSYVISEDKERYLNTGHPLYYFGYKAKKYYPRFLTI